MGRDEGVFLTTAADDGSRAVYFVARGARHSILEADLQAELRANPLRPVRSVQRDEVLAYPEASPIGSARPGLVVAPSLVAEAEARPVLAEVDDVQAVVDDAAAAGIEPTTHVLQRGDNLTRISRAYGTTVEAILQANGISNANLIYAGQALVIPVGAPAQLAESEPTLPASAETFDVPEEAVAEDPSDASAITHTVQRGESAIAIARRFGVDVDHLLGANNVADRNRIYAGQTLTIPGA